MTYGKSRAINKVKDEMRKVKGRRRMLVSSHRAKLEMKTRRLKGRREMKVLTTK